MTRRAQLVWSVASIAFAAFLALVWHLVAANRLVAPVFLPLPGAAFDAMVAGFENGSLASATLFTLERIFYGWVLASVLGIAIGGWIGISRVARIYVTPTLELLRPLPASAAIPVAITFFGLSDTMVLVSVGFGALWPMLLATAYGVGAVDPRLIEVSRILRLSKWRYVRAIALPNALPDILSAMRVGIVVAMIITIVGEMLTSRPGLGQWVMLSARNFRSADLYAGIILLGVIGLVSALFLSLVEYRLLRWRPK
jgi:ABC-type nitrate/sulfonate/bicarbonate transport system permease component